jgi:heme A synthase
MHLSRFAKFAWGLFAYNLVVVAWGAFVRASGSGAGCGSHWPTCNGEVIPHAKAIETLIEFTHRATSGLLLVLVIAQTVWATKRYERGHVVRKAAMASLALTLSEALIGAAIVLYELVAHDASMKRALSMSLHLNNTFLLVGALALTAFWASGGKAVRLRHQGLLAPAVGAVALGVLFVGTSGALAALGDTLFPAASLRDGWEQDRSLAAHFLVRLRILHPVIAVASFASLVAIASTARALRPTRPVHIAARALTALAVTQVLAGVLNLVLLAPVAMQIVHLLLADLVWTALILLGATALEGTHAARAAGPLTENPATRAAN